MHGLIALFVGAIACAIILLVVGLVALYHPSCHRICSSLHPSCPAYHDHGINHLNYCSQVCNRCNHIGCFNDSRDIYDCNTDGSLIHGYMRQEDELFSFPLAAACPWQSSQENQLPCWLVDTAERRQSS
jgi:hypothetical protein